MRRHKLAVGLVLLALLAVLVAVLVVRGLALVAVD
jgi:hypothetical protein